MHEGASRKPAGPPGPDLIREAAEAIDRIGDSSRSTSDLGNDPAAPPVLEVLELWGGNLLGVGHFDARKARVVVGDPDFGRLRPWSTALTVALVLGVGVLMARHATLPEPSRYLDGDEALIADWTAAVEADRQARARAAVERRQAELEARQVEAALRGIAVDELEPEPTAPEPPDPLQAYRAAWDEARQADYESLRDRFPEEPWRWLGGAPFELAFRVDQERILRDELLPLAREEAARGQLRRSWIREFEEFESEYPVDDDQAEAIEARLFAWGTPVLHQGQPFVVVPAPGEDQVWLADEAGDLTGVHPDTVLADRVPSGRDRADRRGLHDQLQRLLFQDAVARKARGQECRAVGRLVVLAGAEADFELQARQASCLHRRGLRDEAAPFVERAMGLLPVRPADPQEADLIGGLLQVRAEHVAREAAASPELRGEALDAWHAARSFVIDELQDPGALAVADHGIHQLEQARLATRQERLVKRALQLGLFVGLLLPLGLLVDERRSRRGAPDFAVPGWDLPSDPFTLVEVEHGQVRVCFGRDQVGMMVGEDGAGPSTADLAGDPHTEDMGGWLSAPLPDDRRFLLQLGQRVFSVRRVEAAKAVVAPVADGFDWRFAGTLAAVLLLGGGLAVISAVLPSGGPSSTLIHQRIDTVSLAAPVLLEQLPEVPGPEGGDKAAGDEGTAGDPQAESEVPEVRIAVSKRSRDEELVDGLINDLFVDDSYVTLSSGNLDQGIFTAAADLGVHIPGLELGPGTGRGPRGHGPGGGGTRLSGVSIHDGFTGGPRRGPGGGTGGRPQSKGPVHSDGAIFLSGIDKSAVDRVVKSHLASIRYCYQRELPGNPDMAGKVVIKFVIAKDGTVSQSTVRSSTLNSPAVERCLTERFGRMRFVKPKGGGIAVVSYPLVFSSAG